MRYKCIELKSCVKGEQINVSFSGSTKLYMAILTEVGYNDYEEDIHSVPRDLVSGSPARFVVHKEGVIYVVADLNGYDMRGVKFELEGRYAPNIMQIQIDTHYPSLGKALVRNAEDTTTEGSMVQYWEDNKSSSSKIDLDKFVCPSCQKQTSRDRIHGAHVQKIRGSKWYITPTCDSCNTSKTKRIFQVNTCDLVEAPNN